MIETFVDRVLLRSPVSRAAKAGWAAFLILGPLAYLGGSVLEERATSRDAAVVQVDRDGARALAQEFAADHGIDAANWPAYITLDPSGDLMEYFRLNRGPAAARARSFSSPVTVRTLLVSPAGDRAEIFLDQQGRVSGYDFTRVKAATEGAPLPVEQATAIARQAVESIPNLTSVLTLRNPEVESNEKTGKGCRNFTWHGSSATLEGITFEIATSVCGSAAVRRTVKAQVAEDYARERWQRASRPVKVLQLIYGLYIAIAVLYSIYRYARRAAEREVSHARTLALAGVIGAAITASFLTGLDEYVWGLIVAGQGIIWYPLLVVILSFLILGLGVAIMYGAGEGDLRELYPGKLTSLDALFRGKLFSRNVARAALFGTAYAAWMLLLEGMADWMVRPDTERLTGELMKLPFLRAPLLAIFVSQTVFVSVIPTTGLLLPLAFAGRRVHSPRIRKVLVIVFAALGSLATAVKYGELWTALVGVALISAILAGAFFGMDLLAAIFGIGAFLVATAMARLVALSPSWLQLGAAVGALGLSFLLMEVWAALRGVEYLEEEVRPAYAGNIAARQQMQAELAAAREAQLHLLPRHTPEVHGLFVQAGCVPARIVGGDFYDFYPLGEGRLGIFIAEGGNRGIGSALSIALAKGFLMQAVRRNPAPRDLIQRLESTLGPLLEGSGVEAATHVAYAVIDTAAATLQYARTGDYPRVLVGNALVSEQSIKVPDTGTTLYEGGASLRTGDTVLLFTDGIARRVRTTGPTAAEGILKTLAKKRRAQELEDDLTAVVVRITRAGAAIGVVA